MGKTLLYHPVGLYVIRGALQYCDIKLGRLTQKSADKNRCVATYQAEIKQLPDDLKDAPLWLIAKRLRECFADDITVTYVTSTYTPRTKKTTLFAKLFVQLTPPTPMERMIENAQ